MFQIRNQRHLEKREETTDAVEKVLEILRDIFERVIIQENAIHCQ